MTFTPAMTFTPSTIGLTQIAVLGAGMDDGSKLRCVVGGLGAVSLTAVLGGCQAPQPAPRNHESQIPPNQQSCANSQSEFCRSLPRTEKRVELMRDGRDEYNNHNQSLFWMAGAGGVLATALLFVTFRRISSCFRAHTTEGEDGIEAARK